MKLANAVAFQAQTFGALEAKQNQEKFSTLSSSEKIDNLIPMALKNDIDLVSETKEGRPGAFSELVKRHRKYMVALVYKMTGDNCMSDDVVQEALMKAYTKIHLFQGRSTFKSWLYRITVNTARNSLRSKSRIMVPIEENTVTVQPKNDFQLFLEHLNGVFKNEIGQLPDRQKLALKLRIFEDMSFKEIAQYMSCPYDTAKANYRHALLKLKKKFQKMDY
jgi:RNA polymerase sigma-70 factor (ECF subfamily)